MDYDFDFAVAGSGPAGASAAISLAQLGHSVVVFERETFPRFHIGESLLSTANDHFAALGVEKQMAAARFPEKWGARLYTHDGSSGRGVDFSTVTEVKQPRTVQVSRAEFDHILMKRAREAGADVREATRVTGIDFHDDGVIIEFQPPTGPFGTVRVRAIVDATGRAGLLASKFKLRTDEPKLANIAIFSHYSGVPRLPDDRPNDIRLIAREDSGWFWLIPISDDLMSVGVVIPRTRFMQMPEGTNEERLERAFADTPVVTELMKNAKREWPVRVEKDFSYSASKYAGDRWILAGDAGSFLDPVFSTGVSIAMESGIEAAKELDRAKKRNAFAESSFAAYARRQKERYETYRRFVVGFYTPQFRDLFFDPQPPKHIFKAVVTVLCGRWDASLKTRLLNRFFFFSVGLQKRFSVHTARFRRDAAAGYIE
jgi:flavin-dependent dehydrogenase